MRLSIPTLFLLLALAGCASYHPLPLATQVPIPSSTHQTVAAAGQGIDFQQPLTGTEVAQIAVMLNPNLRALRAERGVAQAQVFAAGLLPDPQLSLSADLPSNVSQGYFNAYGIGLQWNLASLFTRSTRLAAARAQRRSVQYQVAWQEWMLANQARIQARRWYYLHRQETLAAAATQVSTQLYRVAQENLQQGDTTISSATLRQIAYLDSQDQQLALQRQLSKARLQLNQTLGLPPDFRVQVAAPRPLGPIPPVSQLVALAIQHRLDLRALRAGYAAQEAQVRTAILGQYPAFSIGVSHAADTSNIQTFGPSINLSIPLWNRNRGAIAQARATRAQLHAAYSARLFQTRAEISALVRDLQRLQAEITPLAQQVPALQKAEQRLRVAASEHDVTLLDYETVRSQSLAKSLQLLSLQEAQSTEEAALEMAVGIPWQEWKQTP
ncbi:TolC family protein [Igneacidithiobacillus siniensis]|uniref:TolC family protein n=1 Tax=Acidithiobacillus TaxID=119977 RepID=UPI002010623B|nr:TolC family protein [Acidithiobacillus sp. S30A2]